MTTYSFTNLLEARDTHQTIGGWLLKTGDSHYTVTDDEDMVRDLRGDAFLEECERTEEWDETAKH